jgi:hypothetical protein
LIISFFTLVIKLTPSSVCFVFHGLIAFMRILIWTIHFFVNSIFWSPLWKQNLDQEWDIEQS